jgi:hypothetical protein
MGKRSDFVRLPQDKYDTPAAAVMPLLPHLKPGARFIEPCCGAGCLVGHLKHAGHVLVSAFDLPIDARTTRYAETKPGVVFITNPPWSRPVLHEIIINLSNQAPAWLLIDADGAHTKQPIPYLPHLRKIVSVGRVKWIPDSQFTGKDNCAWHRFEHPHSARGALFFGRVGAESITTTSKGEQHEHP